MSPGFEEYLIKTAACGYRDPVQITGVECKVSLSLLIGHISPDSLSRFQIITGENKFSRNLCLISYQEHR